MSSWVTTFDIHQYTCIYLELNWINNLLVTVIAEGSSKVWFINTGESSTLSKQTCLRVSSFYLSCCNSSFCFRDLSFKSPEACYRLYCTWQMCMKTCMKDSWLHTKSSLKNKHMNRCIDSFTVYAQEMHRLYVKVECKHEDI